MCPDRELLSAYVDGEVPSPWRERIAEHLAGCGACSAAVERYASLGARLREGACPGEADIVARGKIRFDAMLAAAGARDSRFEDAAPARPRGRSAAGLWTRSVSLPLPMAAAAALVLFLLAGLAAAGLLRPNSGRAPVLASAEVVPNAAHEVSMDSILRYLNTQNAQVTLTINLPSEATFNEPGTPVIVRAPKSGSAAAPVTMPPSGAAGTEEGAPKGGTP